MPTYEVNSAASAIVVSARSSIHDTDTRWEGLEGTVEADPDTLETEGARGSFTVDMTRHDAGDWLKNRKLKKDLDVANHPRATFTISGLRDVHRRDDGTFEAVCDGVMAWRGKEVPISVRGTGRVDAGGIDARGTFDLDIRELGVEPPKILMFKVEHEVTVEVTLKADAV